MTAWQQTLRSAPVGWLLTLAALAWIGWQASHSGLVLDQAYISLRYAENSAAGHGLVFNPGERFEGYTNFLWTWLLSWWGGHEVSLSIARWLGVGCMAGLIVLLGVRAVRQQRVPLAAMGVAASSLAVLSAAGTESAALALLLWWIVQRAGRAEGPSAWFRVGIWCALVALLRADALLFYFVVLAVAFRSGRRSGRGECIVACALPAILLLVPYAIWKTAFYGKLFPATWFARSVWSPYFSAGFEHLGALFRVETVLVSVALAAWAGALRSRSIRWSPVAARTARVAAVGSALYVLYVVWVGGDQVVGRLLLPLAPLWWSVIEDAVHAAKRWVFDVSTVGVCVLAGATGHALDEAESSTAEPAALRATAERLRELAGEQSLRIATLEQQAGIAYFGRFDYAIDAASGRTDANLARGPLPQRGEVGREKAADYAYLANRRVQFVLADEPPPFLQADPLPAELRQIDFGRGVRGYLVTWQNDLMRALQRDAEVRVPAFDAWLDGAVARARNGEGKPSTEVYEALKAFYFDRNPEDARQVALRP